MWGFEDKEGTIKIEPTFEDAKRFYEGLAAVKHEGKWGFINSTGKFHIQPVFERVQSFSEDLAAARQDWDWGFIGKTGEWVIPARYKCVLSFSEGLAAVNTTESQFGFVNKSGHFTEITAKHNGQPIEPISGEVYLDSYEKRYCFCEGLAAIEIGNRWGFINRSGEIVIPPIFENVNGFSEGVSPAKQQQRWGYIDRQGDFLIQPQFLWSGRFKGDIAKVIYPNHFRPYTLGDRSQLGLYWTNYLEQDVSKITYTDRFWRRRGLQGMFYLYISSLLSLIRSPFSLSILRGSSNIILTVGFIGAFIQILAGESIVALPWLWILGSLNGFVGVCGGELLILLIGPVLETSRIRKEILETISLEDDIKADSPYRISRTGKHLINKSGQPLWDVELIKEPQFFQGYSGLGCESPSGLIPFLDRGKFGYVDGDLGERTIPPRYSYAGPFQHGLACISFESNLLAFEGNKYGSINTHGKIVIPPQMDLPYLFDGRVAVVKFSGKFGLIDRDGQFVVEPKYDEIKRDSSLQLSFVGKRKRFLFRYLLPFQGRAYSKNPNNYGLIDDLGNEISPMIFNAYRSFSNGIAPVKVGKLWGFINTKGELEIHPQYQDAKSFFNGLAAVKVGSRWGYINAQGEMVIKPQFRKAEHFWEDTAKVQTFGFLGLPGRKRRIDKSGCKLLMNPAS